MAPLRLLLQCVLVGRSSSAGDRLGEWSGELLLFGRSSATTTDGELLLLPPLLVGCCHSLKGEHRVCVGRSCRQHALCTLNDRLTAHSLTHKKEGTLAFSGSATAEQEMLLLLPLCCRELLGVFAATHRAQQCGGVCVLATQVLLLLQ